MVAPRCCVRAVSSLFAVRTGSRQGDGEHRDCDQSPVASRIRAPPEDSRRMKARMAEEKRSVRCAGQGSEARWGDGRKEYQRTAAATPKPRDACVRNETRPGRAPPVSASIAC